MDNNNYVVWYDANISTGDLNLLDTDVVMGQQHLSTFTCLYSTYWFCIPFNYYFDLLKVAQIVIYTGSCIKS